MILPVEQFHKIRSLEELVGQPDHNNLLFETSPYGNLDAIVEHDTRAVYLYLSSQGRADSKFGTRACWVRNLVPGPYVINEDEMKQGIPPVLPRTHCKYSDSRPVPDAERLQIVWFEEGNGIALVETSETGEQTTLAVIPPWSGLDGFHGYANEWPLKTRFAGRFPTTQNYSGELIGPANFGIPANRSTINRLQTSNKASWRRIEQRWEPKQVTFPLMGEIFRRADWQLSNRMINSSPPR